jgi:hypothetical protein
MNIDRFKIIGVLLFLLTTPFNLFGQLPGNVSSQIEKLVPKPAQQTPNSAGIQKYGDFNVNLSTGIPDISIPLFEIQSGDIRVPIVLSYHAGGTRYTDRASWAGLGWSVQVGGQITRTIQGKPDENGFLTGTNDYTVDTYDFCNHFSYKEHTASGSNDREPDLFSYTFPGESGRFVLRQGGLPPQLFPESAIKVTRNPNFYDITDTKGTMYRFGSDWSGTNAARESTNSTSGSTVTSGVVTWYLQEIKSPNTDDFVTFTYQDVGSYIASEIESNISLMDNCTTTSAELLPCTSYSSVETLVSTSNSTTQMGINEIYYNTGKVTFLKGANRTDVPGGSSMQRLSKIEVYSKVNNDYVLLKTFTLLNSGNFKLALNNADARLKLDGLEIRDGANTLINKYAFTYNSTTFSWDKAEGSFARDLFGFYNGKTTNTNLIPKETVQYRAQSFHTPTNLEIGGADRSTDTTFYQEGVLKRITFPTGGYTEFQYEPHKYSDGGVTKYGAGLRIKKILKNDGLNTYSTLYKYGLNDDGFGHKNFDVRNFHFMNSIYSRDINNTVIPFPQRQYTVRTWVSNSVVGPGFDDAPIVYTNVSEYANSTTGNGKTIYEFDNRQFIADGVFAVPYSNKIWRNKKSWQRGKLTKVTKYDNLNNIKEVTTKTYTMYKGQTIKVGQAALQVIVGEESGNFFFYCSGTGGGQPYDGHRYIIATIEQDVGVFLETSTKVASYFGSDSIQSVSNKAYHATYLQPTYEEVVSSGNPGFVRTNFRYNYDIVGIGTTYSGLPDAYKQMLIKNMIYKPVEQYTWVKEGTGANEVISGQITEYMLVSGTSIYAPASVYFFESSTPVTNYAPLVVSGTSALTKDSRYKLRMSMQGYDIRGNLLQYSLTDGLTSSFIYGHDGKYLIAEATDSTLGNIAFTSFETNEKGGWTYAGAESPVMAGQAKTGSKVYLLNNGQISKFISGNYKLSFWARRNSASPASLTINGAAYTGTLDDTWRLVEVSGSGSVTISGSGTVIDELRVHPATGLMTTYTIKPQIGIWSILDAKNQGSYYHYDPFGRLETVKNDDGHILKHFEYTYIKP